MKNLITTMVLLTIAITLTAQTPQAFQYQVVARDNAGNVLVNQNVTFRFSILQGSASGTLIFSETHEAITNEFGLVNLEIGNGEPETGFLTEIDWSTGEKFLEVELDPVGGYTFISMGTTQLLSVPYSLYSESSGNAGATEINELTDAKTAGNNVYLGLDAGADDDGTNNQNVAVGREALNANTSGHHNTATGYYALFSNITGNYNTAYGFNSLFNNTTGNYNTTYGNATNLFNVEGSNNTMIGYQAGRGTVLHNKSGNVFLGYRAGYNDTTDNKLYIENSYSSFPLIYGDFENDILAFNASVGIGTIIPAVNLDIRSGSSTSASKILLGNSDGSTNLFLSSGHESANPYISFKGGDALRFIRYDESFNELMRITSDGWVGIGTANPYAKLDVRGIGIDDGAILRIGNSDGSHRLSFFPGRENDPNPFIQWKEGDPLRFSTDEGGWSEKMRITSDGKVGIGTESPYYKFEVEWEPPTGNINPIALFQTTGSTSSAAAVRVQNTSGNFFNFGMTHPGNNNFSIAYNANIGLSTDLMTITPTGNVGIGTTTPAEMLEVAGIIQSSSGGFMFPDGSMQTTAASGGGGNTLDFAYDQGGPGAGRSIKADNGAVNIYGPDGLTVNGNVGIGTTAPEAGLHVDNTNGVLFTGEMGTGNIPIEGLGTRMMWYPAKAAFRVGRIQEGWNPDAWDDDNIGDNSFAMGVSTEASGFCSITMGILTVASGNSSIAIGSSSIASGEGSMAIGYCTKAESQFSTAMGRCNIGGGDPDDWIDTDPIFEIGIGVNSQDTKNALTVLKNGNVGIGTVSPGQKLEVNGTAKCEMLQCDILHITGGADIAEPFDIVENENILPGMVLVIDPENPGKLKISDKEYDRCVAGIISGAGEINPGMIMGQTESIADGDYPVALSGRVYCYAETSKGKITPGDLITTSNMPGYAMKASNNKKAQGAIIGKAMTSLESGKGLILVLVTLQ